jgi:hypothetical protein
MEKPSHIPISETKVISGEEKPQWVVELDKSEGWAVFPHREVEGKTVYRFAAHNPNLGPHGVTMSVIEEPNDYGLKTLDTWEIKFDDYDEETRQDSQIVAYVNLEEALDMSDEEVSLVLTNKDFWEEFGERYSKKFLSLTNKDIDVSRLFTDSEGIEELVDMVFEDLIEAIEQKRSQD